MKVSVIAVLGVLGVASPAQAEEASPVRVTVHAEGGENAALQERRVGEEHWTLLCEMPCETSATPAPYAFHRVVDRGAKIIPVVVRGADGEHVRVAISRGSTAARTGLFALGTLSGATGLVLFGAGISKISLLPLPSERDCGAPCDPDREEERRGRQLATVGLGFMAASGAMFLIGALVGRTSVSTSSSRRADVATRRLPEWSAPELPKPPPLYAKLSLSF